MIRPTTVLCLMAACGSGLYLYSEKHRTELLDRDIGRVIHATEAARARTGLLRAEWALLNEPGRLGDMAGRYLTLHPMAPAQWVQLADLSTHLPGPLANTPENASDDDDQPPPSAAAAPAPVAASTTSAEPAPKPAAVLPPTATAAQSDAKPVPPKQLASNAAHPRVPRHATPAADRPDTAAPRDGLLARSTPLPLAAPQPVGASVYAAMAHPMRPAATRSRPAIVSAVPTYAAPARPYASPISSALGGGGSLPPPVPFGR